MRRIGLMVVVFAFGLAGVSWVNGQVPGGKGKGFGGKGMFGGGGFQQDAVSLVRNQQVRKELDITDEQLEKLPEALRTAVASVLDAKQAKRLRQIELQVSFPNSLKDKSVQKELKLTDEQLESIKTLMADSQKEIQEAFKDGGFGGEGAKKVQAIRTETNEKITAVFNADQKKQWKLMTGEEFKLQTFGGFGGGGKGKGKKGAKKDIQD